MHAIVELKSYKRFRNNYTFHRMDRKLLCKIFIILTLIPGLHLTSDLMVSRQYG